MYRLLFITHKLELVSVIPLIDTHGCIYSIYCHFEILKIMAFVLILHSFMCTNYAKNTSSASLLLTISMILTLHTWIHI